MKRVIAVVLVLIPILIVSIALSVALPVRSQSVAARSSPATSPRFTGTITSLAATGTNGFACLIDGCRVDLGNGANDYLYSDGSLIQTPATIQAAVFRAPTFQSTSGSIFTLQGWQTDGSGAIAAKTVNVNTLSTDGANIHCFYPDNGSTQRACVTKDGGMRLGIGAGTAPTCDAAHRGLFYYQPGAAGVKDVVQVCAKDVSDVYAWRAIY